VYLHAFTLSTQYGGLVKAKQIDRLFSPPASEVRTEFVRLLCVFIGVQLLRH